MNEQNKKLEVIKNRCQTSGKVIGIMRAFVNAGIVLTIVSAIICFIFRSDLNVVLEKEIEAGDISLRNFGIDGMIQLRFLTEGAIEKGNYWVPLMLNCILGCIICIVFSVILGTLRKIFKSLAAEETPFSDYNLKQLRIGFIVTTVALTISIGLGVGIICGLICWSIYSILEYGAALQNEVDEIL
ncbi:MAG: hypothetical protein K6A23_06380 [Butyrivibrio sp.]|nr:hypothetical protein [Butyrivibrio sp.]